MREAKVTGHRLQFESEEYNDCVDRGKVGKVSGSFGKNTRRMKLRKGLENHFQGSNDIKRIHRLLLVSRQVCRTAKLRFVVHAQIGRDSAVYKIIAQPRASALSTAKGCTPQNAGPITTNIEKKCPTQHHRSYLLTTKYDMGSACCYINESCNHIPDS